jgi:hypothetical protein
VRSNLYKPWTLVRHNGELRLAFMTSLFGGGIVPGPANGGRGHIMLDNGQPCAETATPVVFKQIDLVYDWRNRPSPDQLSKARQRELAAA